ncbi:hypothetical protein ABZ891_13405 [Streptomyces sp. NPDC047023]|uniref:hypothetical protein n=1 Tax=Streptomyces sp. NPDC047023 TaxID=3155139 RepID=UPI0033E94519
MNLDAELSSLAAQEDLPDDLVRRLLQHPQARRSAALLRRDLTPELMEEIIRLGSARTLAANGHVPATFRARFAESPEPLVRAAVAASVSDEPPGLLARLAADQDPSVRAFLAMNEQLPPELLAVLAVDPEASVRSSVVDHWRHAPESVRRAWLTDPDPGIRRAAASVCSPPADLLPALLADPQTRAIAVRYAGPSRELAADPDSGVRRAVAAHPYLSAELRDLLAGDQDAFVRNEIAARPDTPQALRDSIVATLTTDDPVADWFLSFRRNPHTCPPRAQTPAKLTREEAEDLLARAGL